MIDTNSDWDHLVDWDRVVTDPIYRRHVIELLNAGKRAEQGERATEKIVRGFDLSAARRSVG